MIFQKTKASRGDKTKTPKTLAIKSCYSSNHRFSYIYIYISIGFESNQNESGDGIETSGFMIITMV